MENVLKSLLGCPLFKEFTIDEVKEMLQSNSYTLSSFSKHQIIALEGETCSNIGIVIKGRIEVKKIFASGREVVVTNMGSGDIFGEVLLFSDINKYPSSIIAETIVEIMFIPKGSVLRLCSSYPSFLNSLMNFLANKVLMLDSRLRTFSYKSIRQRISRFLTDEYRKQKSLKLSLSCTRREMAEKLSVPRPSLSREMLKMKEEGIIIFTKNRIEILNLPLLEEMLIQ